MNKYEVMFIVRPDVEDETRKALLETFNGIFTANDGVVDSIDEWGLRTLAYEIDHLKRGYYVVVNLTAPSENVIEFERVSRLNSNVIRYITIRK
jgi:ribosomal protein S6